jgi:hypothetical protein
MIATKTISAEVYVFDYSKHPSKPAAGILAMTAFIHPHKRQTALACCAGLTVEAWNIGCSPPHAPRLQMGFASLTSG